MFYNKTVGSKIQNKKKKQFEIQEKEIIIIISSQFICDLFNFSNK